jgi:hypothetical protein
MLSILAGLKWKFLTGSNQAAKSGVILPEVQVHEEYDISRSFCHRATMDARNK